MSKAGNSASSPPDWANADPEQWKVCERFLERPSQWVYAYRSAWDAPGSPPSAVRYCALLPEDRAEKALADPSWEAHIGSGGYGFTEWYQAEGEPVVAYEKYPDDGVELIVIDREFHGVRPSEMELVEEFRLLFNLWEDRASRTYYYFDGSGNPVKAAVIEHDSVRVLWSLVRRYQAAKQMYLALYLDSTYHSPDIPNDGCAWQHTDESVTLQYNRAEARLTGGEEVYSSLMGKRLLPPPPRETCEIAPFDRARQYQDFVIGIDVDGNELTHSSDPSLLANYFGANPGSPHYLTPVYFRREVLNKYYAEGDRFTIEDGYLRCAGLWGLRLDNDQPGHVMVFLGDLGRDIPFNEAGYWKSFNIAPHEEGPSETLYRRAFLAEFADPKSVDLRFGRVYEKTNGAWAETFREPLFKPLHEDDRHLLSKLHIPIGEGQAEFDEQILILAKLLVDSIDEAALEAEVGPGARDEKGLAKLERFLSKHGVEDARAFLKPFANIQGLRSRGAAHRKGADFDIGVALGGLGRREGFEKLLAEAIDVLEALRGVASPDLGAAQRA
jgi:hypothetical protein